MSASTGPDSYLRHALERDRLCDRFESELREGQSPRIEDFLALAPEKDRAGLFRDLLHIELAWGSAGTAAECRDYVERFPDFALTVQRIFANFGGEDTPGPAVAHGSEADATSSRSRAFDEHARFRILRLHSQGGLGIVYVAHDEQLDREVALKEIQPGLANDPNAQKRFEFEALLTSHLEHPGVVPIYAANHRSGGEPYYVSKLIRGETLQDAIQRLHQVRVWERAGREHQLELQRLLRRFLTVCETVAYAHSVCIIHRDLKPNNILLSDFGETLIIDWGLAKPLVAGPGKTLPGELPVANWDRGDLTAAGSEVGTPIYASPEQLRGDPTEITPLTDIYGLGATLYHVLAGRPPYDPEQPSEHIREQVLWGSRLPLRSLQPGIPRALAEICQKAMAVDPAARYESATALAEDIERWLAREPVSAYREPILTRLGRRIRRHRVTSSIVATLAIMGLVAGGFVWYQSRFAYQQVTAGLHQLESAEIEQVPLLSEPLRDHPTLAARLLTARLERSSTKKERQVLALAMARLGSNHVDPLARELRSDEAFRHELAQLLVQPAKAGAVGADAFRSLLLPLRAEFWDELRGAQTKASMAEMAYLLNWRESREQLEQARAMAGEVLLEFARDQPHVLAWALTDGTDEQFERFLELLKANPGAARSELHRVLREQALLDFVRPKLPTWSDPSAEVVQQIEAADGAVHPLFAWCQTMPLATYLRISEALRPTGYRPSRFRPYSSADAELRVAAIWARDGLDWAVEYDRPAEDTARLDKEMGERLFRPIDVALYQTSPRTPPRYAALWTLPMSGAHATWRRQARTYCQAISAIEGEPAIGLHVGWTVEDARREEKAHPRQSWSIPTVQSFSACDGRIELAVIEETPVSNTIDFDFTCGDGPALHERLAHASREMDICVRAARSGAKTTTYLGTWREPGEFATTTLIGLSPGEHRVRGRELQEQGYFPTSISVDMGEDGQTTTGSVWQRISRQGISNYPAQQRVRAAVALARLGETEPMWQMLRHSPDPSERTLLIELLPRYGISMEELIARFESEADVSARRALLLALGGYEPEERGPALIPKLGPVFVSKLLHIVRDEGDPGLRAAAIWLLRRMKQEAELAGHEAGPPRGGPARDDSRGWFLDHEGRTYTIIREPGEFTMGYPRWDTMDEGLYSPHRVRIPRDFAIGMTEVTVGEFQRFREEMSRRGVSVSDKAGPSPFNREPNGPALGIDFFTAARYCNWLSEQEGVPETQWCFRDDAKDGIQFAPDYLHKSGYRLPTEAEWEFACQAGAETRRFCGRGAQGSEPLPSYAWFNGNSGNHATTVGRLKPNDLGLFDVLGNAHEWCLDSPRRYCVGRCDQIHEDVEVPEPLRYDTNRALRGGWFQESQEAVQSNQREWEWAAYAQSQTGFRLARTLSKANHQDDR